jgi:hypothetical protein
MKISAGAPASICRASVDEAANDNRIVSLLTALYSSLSCCKASVRLAAAKTVIVSAPSARAAVVWIGSIRTR